MAWVHGARTHEVDLESNEDSAGITKYFLGPSLRDRAIDDGDVGIRFYTRFPKNLNDRHQRQVDGYKNALQKVREVTEKVDPFDFSQTTETWEWYVDRAIHDVSAFGIEDYYPKTKSSRTRKNKKVLEIRERFFPGGGTSDIVKVLRSNVTVANKYLRDIIPIRQTWIYVVRTNGHVSDVDVDEYLKILRRKKRPFDEAVFRAWVKRYNRWVSKGGRA